MGSITEQLRDWWIGLDKSQRPMYLMGVAFLAILILGAIFLAGRPNMSLLFAGLSPADQGMVVQELNKIGVNAEYDANGNVLVPANKVNEARAKLAVAKKLPSSGNLGYGTLDTLNPMISPEVEREKIKNAIEGEIANSIQSIAGVAAARVHLTLGDNSPFAREARPATASIIVTEEPGGRISQDQSQAIVRLVQFGISGLKAENISVVNDRGQTLYDGVEANSTTASADRKVNAEIEEARRREQDLQRKLDLAFGTGNTIVSIPVLTLNFDKVSETSLEKGPSSKPVTKETVSEKLGDSVSTGLGQAGAVNNVQAPTEGADAERKNYEGKHEKVAFEVNEVQKSIQRSAGNLEGMTVNVLVNTKSIKNPGPVQQYVQNYLGPFVTQAPDRFQATITAVEFDETHDAVAKQASAAATAKSRTEQIMQILPVAALLIVGFLLVRSISKGASQLRPAPMNQFEVALPGGGTMSLPTAALDNMPAGSGTPMLDERGEHVIAIEGGELAQALHALASSSSAQVNIDDIPDRVNIPLEQIKKMALTKPESVANLIKTWILEERR